MEYLIGSVVWVVDVFVYFVHEGYFPFFGRSFLHKGEDKDDFLFVAFECFWIGFHVLAAVDEKSC